MDAQLSLYDYSKQVVSNEPPMDIILFNTKALEIGKKMSNYKYVMLLCHEKRDYTIFHNATISCPKAFATELTETIYNRGQVIFADEQQDGAWEIWVRDRNTNENFAYYLFNYEQGVIEVE